MQTVVDIGRQHAAADKSYSGRRKRHPNSAEVRHCAYLTAPMPKIADKCMAVHVNRRIISIILLAVNTNLVSAPGAIAATLSKSNFMHLAVRCAPSVPPQILEAVAETESGLDPYALHDDTTGTRERAASLAAAEADAAQWMQRGDFIDVGLMQINSENFQALGLTLRMALDSCDSMRAGAAVLQAAYGGGKTPAEREVALLIALSRYNTGTPFRGILNGYARTVLTNVKTDDVPIETDDEDVQVIPDSHAPSSWNVAAVGNYARIHGAPWLTFSFQVAQDFPARSVSIKNQTIVVPTQENFIVNQ